jgi:malonate-semialdehyde dehydrogenase (acetylating)/methylmalonate-semialdehyde dehydrogenase
MIDLETVGHVVAGERHIAGDGRFGDVHDPATGERLRRVAYASAADVDLAVGAATAAQPGWAAQSLPRRTAVLFAFRELLATRRDDVARLITAEHGKTLDDARGEVGRGLEVVEFACGIGHLLKGEASEGVGPGIDSHSLRQPLGVAAGITPFNFPAMVPLWMFPLAIAAGNAFVLKPSERDPSASVLLAELFAEAGLPPGVLNVVHGDREAVDALLTHPGVAAVSFVGSTPVARHVYETGAAHGKRVQALGGAKNHAVVLPDADLDLAADAIASAAFGSAGQRCMAISAAVAVGEVGDELTAKLVERADALRVGPGSEDGVEMGPVITLAARDRIAGAVDAGVTEGARLARDGRDLLERDGFFVGPTILDEVAEGTTVHRDELFGPLLVVLRAPTAQAALELVDRHRLANGVAIFTGDGRAAREFASRIHVGMVGINVPLPVPVASYSFGGWKTSLHGDLHVYGREGVLFYTRGKVITERWPQGSARGPDYSFPS